MRLTAKQIQGFTQARWLAGPQDALCLSVSVDSRTAEKNLLFVAFAGERVDGNNFVEQAIQNGATCVCMTAEPSEAQLAAAEAAGCALLRAEADDGEEFLLRLAQGWRELHPRWLVVGVTGSVGKTTTRQMIAEALASTYTTHATKGNFNNLIGMPLSVLGATDETEALVVEMGMNHFGEIDRLARAAAPQIGVITNVGTAHIGILGSRENIAHAKGEICRHLQSANTVAGATHKQLCMVSEDDFTPFIRQNFAEPAGVSVCLVGYSASSQLHAEQLELDAQGQAQFEAHYADGQVVPCQMPVPGRALVSDMLLALQVADLCGVERTRAAQSIAHMQATHMRLEAVGGTNGKPRMLDDSYNASPASVAAALDVLCSMDVFGRRVAVLGEIGELGDHAERLHALIGAYCAAKNLDLLVFIGTEFAPLMRSAALEMGASDDKILVFASVDAALEVLKPIFVEQDCVLVKASRAAGLDQFVKGVLA